MQENRETRHLSANYIHLGVCNRFHVQETGGGGNKGFFFEIFFFELVKLSSVVPKLIV